MLIDGFQQHDERWARKHSFVDHFCPGFCIDNSTKAATSLWWNIAAGNGRYSELDHRRFLGLIFYRPDGLRGKDGLHGAANTLSTISEESLRVLCEIAEHGAQHISFDRQIFSGCRGVNCAP